VQDSRERIPTYLGIDVGSISTNLAVIDEQGRLLAKRYLMTAGRPIEAVRQGLDEIGGEIGDKVEILGVGTTGSGRYMIADFVGADIVKNEITAQAQAAIEIDPKVDTIFEIGGQDSKYISIKDGIIVDFEMNKACAAGTGSFLEEQAEKLGISIKNEFSDIAFQSSCPSLLGERCTVFMENSLLARQQRGIPQENLVAGLSYSIVQNYINRVVGDRNIGDRIFFQGGTAFNKAVVAAFEKFTGREITVPPNHDVTGAIGMAIIAMRYMKSQTAEQSAESTDTDCLKESLPVTGFKGFDLSKRKYEINSFECKGCDNLCEINRVKIEGEKDNLFFGSRCEKYDVKRKKKLYSGQKLPDLFAEREELLTKAHRHYLEQFREQRATNGSGHVFRIGIPRIFFFHDFLPFFAESCFPHKVAHGHIKDLMEQGVDAILNPSFININTDNGAMRGLACPYVQTMPYVSRIAFRGKHGLDDTLRFISPVINMGLGKKNILRELHKALKPFHVSMKAIEGALSKAEKAQEAFSMARKRRGKEALEQIHEKTIVILGRAYNAFDSGVNLEIPKKLSDIGVFSIPMDFLPLEEIDIHKVWPQMYWRSGQNLLRAAEIIRNNPNLFALYIGNFSWQMPG
jgi:predicted CoA-substrate-specific enzyme activase